MSAVTTTSPYGLATATDMLSESVYNFAATSSTRRTTSTAADQSAGNDSQLYGNSSNKLQLAASIQQPSQQPSSQIPLQQMQTAEGSKPRNKRKNFKPINSRMAEISDESDEREEDQGGRVKPSPELEAALRSNADGLSMDCEIKSIILHPEDGGGSGDDAPAALSAPKTSKVQQPITAAIQRHNNNEVIPMDLSVTAATIQQQQQQITTATLSSEGDDDTDDDSVGHEFLLGQSHKPPPAARAKSPTSESSGRSTKSTCYGQAQDGQQQQQRETQDEGDLQASKTREEIDHEIECENVDDDDDDDDDDDEEEEEEEGEEEEENKPFENMREYAESTMQELLAIYGLQSGGVTAARDLAKTVNKQSTLSLLNENARPLLQCNQDGQQQMMKMKKEDKGASNTAPGSPPTPPRTPSSPSRQMCSGGGGVGSANNNGKSGGGSAISLNVGSPNIQQVAAAAVIAAGLHPGLAAGSPLKQILVENPALAQLLQQNPAILSQNPQLAQLLQQNIQAHLSSNAYQQQQQQQGKSSADDDDEITMSPAATISTSSLAAMKLEAAICDPKVSVLLGHGMSTTETLLGSSATGILAVNAKSNLSAAGGGGSSQTAQQQQPIIDYSRYVRRYGSGQECGSSYCKELGCREHFHCLDCGGGSARVFVKKEEMIRHFKWHKKRDESLQHGFMRYSPTDDCAERHPGRQCPHNRKQTHYHCIHENCDKVYISTSDVQMHANYHRKDSAIIQEGFQRFRATESCATEHCPFVGQRTTHFHCRRSGCRYTFKNKADMDKHKSYHIKDEQLSRDGFKKFMKSEACPFDQCRFSRVCNHIHCIRPQCNYVLHSSGQLFSHKRKHERNDTELAYRRYKQASAAAIGTSGGGGTAPTFRGSTAATAVLMTSSSLSSSSPWLQQQQHSSEELAPQALSFNGGESSNEEQHGSPSFYSMDDSFQSNADFAMDLTAATTFTCSGGSVAASEPQQQQLTPIELAYLITASTDCSCDFGKEHYHCGLERCGAVLRDPREVREHLREHETQERITDAFFEEGGCGDDSNCPYTDKEKHYHCNWDNCREVILATDKPFRRLQHYKIHEYSRQLNLSCSSHPLSSEVTLTHLTNIDAMFRRKRGRPPKNRVIEIWSEGDVVVGSGSGPTGHHHTQDSPQAIFTSFKLPKIAVATLPAFSGGGGGVGTATTSATVLPYHHHQQQLQQHPQTKSPAVAAAAAGTDQSTGREGSISPADNDQNPVGFSTYGPTDPCPDNLCCLRSTRHHHCSQPRCHFSTDRPDQLLMHSKDFHDNVDIPAGFAFFDRMVDCRLTTCHNNRTNRHFHCTRCDYTFVRYSAMTLHDKEQHGGDDAAAAAAAAAAEDDDEGGEMKPRIHVKDPAELIETRAQTPPNEDSSTNVSAKTTVVRAAGTYYPVTGPPSESAALPVAMLSMRASAVHQDASAAAAAASQVAVTISQSPATSLSLFSSCAQQREQQQQLYGPEQSCGRPFCKLKRKNHYHCNACNQAFSELDRLVTHIAKHSAGAILGSQQQQQQQQQQPSTPLDPQQHPQLDFMNHFHQHHHHHSQQQPQQQQQSYAKRERIEQQQQQQQGIDGTDSRGGGGTGRENNQHQHHSQQQPPQPQMEPLNAIQQQAPSNFDLSHSFHFPSPVSVMAAMNQQIALMNQTLPPFLQHGSMYATAAGAPSLIFASGLPPNTFLPTAGRDAAAVVAADNPLASLAANLNLTKRSLSPSETTLSASDAKKQRLHHSMRMLKDEPVPDGYIRFRFNEDCRYPHCGYREHQTHFHCMRQDCGYSFCDKTRFVQHTARHERLDTLMGGDFQQYRANVPCGRSQCAYTSSLGSMQNKASHFHCLKCDFVCTDTNKVVAHRRQHAKLDSIAAAGFQKFTPSQPCGALQCQHSGKQTHYHCLQCQYAVLGLAQMSAHKYRHMDAA